MRPTPRRRTLPASVLAIAMMSGVGLCRSGADAAPAVATTTTAPATTTPTTTTMTSAPQMAAGPPGATEVQRAKAGLLSFMLEHVDRPRNVADPCPLLSSPSLGFYVGELGLSWSQLSYGVEVAWDNQVGAGVAAVRCGVDLNAAPDPPGAVGVQLQVLILDGQATFSQYAVRVGGRDVVVEETDAGGLAGRCTNGGRSCLYALDVDGLVITVQAVGLPADTGATLTQRLAVEIAPEVVANLAAIDPMQ